MNDETIAKIKEANQRLSDLVGLPYTDFNDFVTFIDLLEVKMYKGRLGECTLLRWLQEEGYYDECEYETKLDFIESIAKIIENKRKEWEDVVKAIKREFKGLGDN